MTFQPMSRLGLACFAVLLAVMGCSSSSSSSSASPASGGLVLGAVYPLSGPQSSGGHEELTGVETALDLAQREGLFGGRQVRLQVESATTPNAAREAVDRLIDRYHVPAIIGTYGSTLAEAAAGRADQRHVVYWETGAVADSVSMGRPYVFQTVASGSTLGRAAADFTSDVLLPASRLLPREARVVVAAVDDVYGRAVASGEVARAAEHGIKVVDRIDYDPRRLDADALALRLAGDLPDYLWDVSYIDDGIAIWRAVLAHGVHLRAAVGTSSAFCTPDFGSRMGAQAVGVYAADKPDESDVNPAVLTPAARELLTSASSVYAHRAGGQKMSIPAMAGFVGGWALFHGVLPAVGGAVSPESLRDRAYNLAEPRYSSINGGGIQFGSPGTAAAGQNLLAPAVVGQWQAVNIMRVVYPAPFAEAQPILGS
ncbi:MAG TPA: ABC transporter substrate-binding protein [Candidatus Dormibacteraeota bacterium]|nr:ABC transporter substrate-binding protein [Candidatus Dormibacteraeota bacterium]